MQDHGCIGPRAAAIIGEGWGWYLGLDVVVVFFNFFNHPIKKFDVLRQGIKPTLCNDVDTLDAPVMIS